jgi:hypothetical protein
VTRFASINANTRGKDDVVNEINGLPHPYVKSMVELDGKVYVGTWGGGLGIYDIAVDQWTQIRPSETDLTDGYVAELATSTEHKLYVATNDGVFIYAPATSSWTHFSTVNTDPSAPDYADPGADSYFETVRLQSKVSALEVTDDAGILQRWYGPRVEIKVSDPGLFGITVVKDGSTQYKYSPVNSGLVENNVNDIYFDAVRQTYFVSYVQSGISEVNLDDKTWTDYTLVQGLPSNTVYSTVRAGDGGSGTTMWAATQGVWPSWSDQTGSPTDAAGDFPPIAPVAFTPTMDIACGSASSIRGPRASSSSTRRKALSTPASGLSHCGIPGAGVVFSGFRETWENGSDCGCPCA